MFTRKRLIGVAAIAVLLLVLGASIQKRDSSDDKQWEYLIVAGGNVALSSTTSTPGKRKQNEFRAEASTVEQNLDRLGDQGWELVTVGGSVNEPVFYLKRPVRR